LREKVNISRTSPISSLISITVKVSKVEIESKVAGAKGISGLLNSGEIRVGLSGDVAEPAIEE
jgi:hypothetical protein